MTFTGLARGFEPRANLNVLIAAMLDLIPVQMLVFREKTECSTCTLST